MQTNEMEQFTLSSSEKVSKQNMSETIICNHVVLINLREMNKCGAQRDLLGCSPFLALYGLMDSQESHAVT